MAEPQTIVIDNFHGDMTPYVNGPLNSGLASVVEVFGYDPFIQPGDLTWYETATQIDVAGDVITDLIVCGKTRVESGVVYAYCVGHTGRVYKIQVNDPSSFNPNYDNPVLLATITSGSPTFTRGGFIDFFGATEQIYIGHDKGLTRLNFDGTGEAVVGVAGSWTQTVPRPLQQFLGKLYIGNGSNLAEVDSTATVTTYTKLSPGFPSNTQTRDIDVTPDGNYLQAVVTEQALASIIATSADTTLLNPTDSFLFSWNGSDQGYTSYVSYLSTVLSANLTFEDKQFLFGYDNRGGGVWNPLRKLITSSPASAFGDSPSPNAVFGTTGMCYWSTTLPFEGQLEMLLTMFGAASDYEYKPGYWAPFGQAAQGVETDVLRVPMALMVSNFAQGASSNGYTDQIFGESKIYFSTLETSSAPTTKYKLYKWSPSPSGLGTALTGVYQTQTQIFSKKVSVSEVRIYAQPWVADNAFTIDLIGSGGTPITNGSKSFVAAVNSTGIAADGQLIIGDDFAWYTPGIEPTYALGVRITNDGDTNNVIHKIEIDIMPGGK